MIGRCTFILLQMEDLGGDDFKKFKWILSQKGALEGFPSIPTSRLEDTSRMDTVDQMFHTYSTNTIKVTKMALVKIDKNDLLKNFKDTTTGPTGKNVRLQRYQTQTIETLISSHDTHTPQPSSASINPAHICGMSLQQEKHCAVQGVPKEMTPFANIWVTTCPRQRKLNRLCVEQYKIYQNSDLL
uniref:Pyrin domain-containing protein n=1 Tax=Amphilophus citrinellus TaxID=61819 RepID=A0A3Q0S2I9_AMPCI